jgi:hypothetical protein
LKYGAAVEAVVSKVQTVTAVNVAALEVAAATHQKLLT